MGQEHKVVITGTVGVVTPEQVEEIRRMIQADAPGTQVEFLFDLPVSDEEIIEAAKGATVIFSQYQPMSEKIYKALLPGLRAFVANGIGTNSAKVPLANELGIVVANVPDYCQDEVASHTVAMILAAQRRLPYLEKHIAAGNWGGGFKCITPKKRFEGSTVALYGYGRIPRTVARMLSGFNLNIIAHDPFVPEDVMKADGVRPVNFETLLAEADYLSLHAPLLPSTEGIINKEAIEKMKPSATLINTSRGALVDPQALYNALAEKRLDFAALDVFIKEPPDGIEQEIMKLPNVLVTPHAAYYTDTAMEDLLQKASQECARIVNGERPKNFVNPEAADKITWFK